LPRNESEQGSKMMKAWLVVAVMLVAASSLAGAEKKIVPLFQSGESLSSLGQVDKLVFSRLRQLDIKPANVCSEPVFIRRIYLDVIGTLPTPEEARRYLMSQDKKKRRLLIDELLERPEFADYWALKWGDLLRIKSEFPINLWPNAVQAYHRWVWTCLRDNMPYDQFAREIITASGSNFRVPQVNFYRSVQNRQPEDLAQAVALTFMGTRADKWSEEQRTNMGVFFSQIGYKKTGEWKEEIVYFDPEKAAAATSKGVLPDGSTAELSVDRDPREVFADWLITDENPWFARTLVNRVWFWLMGNGIIHEPDDIRPDNPPSNPRLLDYLEREFRVADYDMKELFRLILNSRTYQLSSIPADDNPKGEANFAFYPVRRLEAEVLIDAVNRITGTTEEYSSPIPEPFTWIPPHQRSIALADGSITSTFLEMFGRPPRDTGYETERNNRPSAAQRLHFLNSSHIQKKIENGPGLRDLLQVGRNEQEDVILMYLTILSRLPTEEEFLVFKQYSQTADVSGRQPYVDLAWALFNSVEFLYRH